MKFARVVLTEVSQDNETFGRDDAQEAVMGRGMDCQHDTHDDVHFSGSDDQDLEGQVRQHRDEYHPEMSDDDVKQIVAANAYDE